MKKFILIFILFLPVIFCHGQNSNDEQAIKKLLEKESSTWRSGDLKGHADCWKIQPYSKILVSTVDGSFIDVPPQMMNNPPASVAGKGGTSVNSNYKMSIHGSDAWVSHEELSTDVEGKKSFLHEIRILEKIDGNWKLVAQSIHAYKPK